MKLKQDFYAWNINVVWMYSVFTNRLFIWCYNLLIFSQATVLEEMPPFPERESSILAKLKKKKPSSVPEGTELKEQTAKLPAAQMSNNNIDIAPPTSINLMSQVSVFSSVIFVLNNSKQKPVFIKCYLTNNGFVEFNLIFFCCVNSEHLKPIRWTIIKELLITKSVCILSASYKGLYKFMFSVFIVIDILFTNWELANWICHVVWAFWIWAFVS